MESRISQALPEEMVMSRNGVVVNDTEVRDLAVDIYRRGSAVMNECGGGRDGVGGVVKVMMVSECGEEGCVTMTI